MSAKEPSAVRLIGALSIAGLIAGLVLVALYLITLPIIQKNRAEALNRAIYKVLPGTKTIKIFQAKDGQLVLYEGPEGDLPKEGIIFGGFDEEDHLLGYAVQAAGPGFQDTIEVIYGFDPKQNAIIGFDVLASKETPGLGDKIFKDADFLKNFEALSVAQEIMPVGKGEKTKPHEVDCISGATISSKAVVKILNGSLSQWLEPMSLANIKKGGE